MQSTSQKTNKPSINAFMEGLLDYAGIFPPANLPLEEAIREYHSYLTEQDSWMLGSFILPVSRIKELEPYMELFTPGKLLCLSVIGRAADEPTTCLTFLNKDLTLLEEFKERYRDQVKITMFEMPLPPGKPQRELLERIAVETAKRGLKTYCELPFALTQDWESQMKAAIEIILWQNKKLRPSLGVKVRTGGLTSDKFPSPNQLASVLTECRDHDIALKFTAGLHHPVRMYRDEVNAKMHGFLNVFCAGMLAYHLQLDVEQVEEILSEEDPAAFVFTDTSLSWRNLSVEVAEMKKNRLMHIVSYGSCSFDEPREELRSLYTFERRNE